MGNLMGPYYFIRASCPPIVLGETPEITWQDYELLLEDNLRPWDKKKLATLLRIYDFENMRFLCRQEPLEPYGNYDERQLEEALLTGVGFPPYFYRFLAKHPNKEDFLRAFPGLLHRFFQQEASKTDGFLHDVLQLERDMRLIGVGYRAKNLGLDLAKELQYEHPDDLLVAQILAQKDAGQFEPPAEYEALKGIFQRHIDDPLSLHQALIAFRFRWIQERLGTDDLSFDAVLGYTLQLIMAWKWIQLDEQKGRQIIDTLVKEKV